MDEILLEAQSREKWRNPVENLQQGDVVLVLERKLLDNGWEIGVLEEVSLGPDGQARSVHLAEQSGEQPCTSFYYPRNKRMPGVSKQANFTIFCFDLFLFLFIYLLFY